MNKTFHSIDNDLPVYYINSKKGTAPVLLGRQLQQLIRQHPLGDTPPIVLCIGTDRVTGDSLGPLTGSFLTAYGGHRYLPIYGTLDAPVHALNLREVSHQIKKKHPRSLILAVDASLGTKNHLGYLTLGQGSLKPGAGVQKNLVSVGDLFLTGIVSADAPEAQLALQNARLASVTHMACCIAQGILYACCPAALAAASLQNR
ncbi:MAG: spore protease YyaC [Lachnospiraceae bacterium]|nr:spore protease YyaC [Lachnospiraceae bacterium]